MTGWGFCRPHAISAQTTVATPASEAEAVVQSPTNMAAAKIAAVDFNKMTSKWCHSTGLLAAIPCSHVRWGRSASQSTASSASSVLIGRKKSSEYLICLWPKPSNSVKAEVEALLSAAAMGDHLLDIILSLFHPPPVSWGRNITLVGTGIVYNKVMPEISEVFRIFQRYTHRSGENRPAKQAQLSHFLLCTVDWTSGRASGM